MSKLIRANFSRLKKDLTFWLGNLFMLVAGMFVSLKVNTEYPLEHVFFMYAILVGLISSVFCSLFIGIEHSDGTMRNKIIAGHTKTTVYIANLILCIIVGLIFCVTFMIPMVTIGVSRLGFFEMNMSSVIFLFITSIALSAAFSSIYLLIAMLTSNKALAAVACILCFVALFCLEARINSRLQEPPFQDDYVMSVNGVEKVNNEPNPDYLTGQKREIYQFICDFLPAGQAVQFIEFSMVHTWQLPLYSVIILVLTSGIGIVVFKRKNLR